MTHPIQTPWGVFDEDLLDDTGRPHASLTPEQVTRMNKQYFESKED